MAIVEFVGGAWTRRSLMNKSKSDLAQIVLDMLRLQQWQPIETAPKDGTLVLLLIAAGEGCEHPLEDSDKPTRTLGFNNFAHDGEDVWKFAGWCWSHDHFTEGKGKPIGWRPYVAVDQ